MQSVDKQKYLESRQTLGDPTLLDIIDRRADWAKMNCSNLNLSENKDKFIALHHIYPVFRKLIKFGTYAPAGIMLRPAVRGTRPSNFAKIAIRLVAEKRAAELAGLCDPSGPAPSLASTPPTSGRGL